MGRKGKLPPRSDSDALVYRTVQMRADAGADEEARTVPVVIATENPVRVFDYQRFDVVDEVLLMDGLNHPRQLPFVDSHDRSSVSNILGSLRDLEADTERGEFRGVAHFGTSARSDQAFRDVMDGHLTDLSIGFKPQRTERIDAGDKKTIRGREFVGPINVVTKSRAVEGSLAIVGADPASKVGAMRAYTDPELAREEAMDKELRDLLIERGMAADLDDKAALDWMREHFPKAAERAEEKPAEPQPAPVAPQPAAATAADSERTVQDAVTRALRDENTRRKAIRELVTMHGLEDGQAMIERHIEAGSTIADVQTDVLQSLAKTRQAVGLSPVAGGSEVEKFRDAVVDSFVLRVYPESHRIWSERKPAPGAQDVFSRRSLFEIASESLRRDGARIDSLRRDDIIRAAMGFGRIENGVFVRGPAHHTIGSFSNLMLDAANKTLLMGFREAPVTYDRWARKGSSVPDFKNINRIKFGELANPEIVPENAKYPDVTVTDGREVYKVEKHGHIFSTSWESVKNDDLDAFTRLPAMQGNAMRRRINSDVYSVLTDNNALNDGTALFAAATTRGATSDGNLITSGAAPSVATLGVGYELMARQTGLDGRRALGLVPRYLLIPVTLSSETLQLMYSPANPAVGGNTTGSSGVANIYAPGGPRAGLEVIADPVLDGNSTAAWYLAADPLQIDTVEYTFLEGEETPVLERETDFDTDTLKWKIRQTYGVAAIDFRGLFQNDGA